MDDDKVFKALGDPTRRTLLDQLRRQNGQTLGELCGVLSMTRQSVTQHLGLLEDANLISTRKRGREKLHFINPVPLHDVYERWVRKFEEARLGLLHDIKSQLERENAMTEKSKFLYVTYIRTTPEKVFEAITKPGLARQYWGHENVSDWKPGSKWEHVRANDERTVELVGEVVESDPPRRLVITWAAVSKADDPEEYSRVTFDIEESGAMVKLTVTHDQLQPGSGMEAGISKGWPLVLSSMKSFLETGTGMEL
ncbi:metalloregulator ArsR/SmtB family transcription factor [Hoeflea sp. CAU 1731]